LRAKVSAAVALRNCFIADPIIVRDFVPLAEREQKYIRLTSARWPSVSGLEGSIYEDTLKDLIVVPSLDGVAKLTMPLHGRTYTVQWCCPLDQHCSINLLRFEGTGDVQLEEPISNDPCRRLFVAGGAAVGVTNEHVWVSQTFAVADELADAWAYPLLLGLSTLRESCCPTDLTRRHLDRALACAAARVRALEADGRLVDSGDGGVSTPLPVGFQASLPQAWGPDATSPAAAMGAGGGGIAAVLWTPVSTTWLHHPEGNVHALGEATVLLRDAEDHRRVICSSQGGRFWRHIGESGEELQVDCAALLPLDASSRSLSQLLTEARKWLRHNELQEAGSEVAMGAASTGPIARSCGSGGRTGSGWVIEGEAAEPGVGRLSLLRLAGAGAGSDASVRMVRVLFEDGTRVSFSARTSAGGGLGEVGDGDTFRALDARGETFVRSFGAPSPCERHALVARALFERLRVDPDEERVALSTGLALAAVEQRRSAVLLQVHGSFVDSICKDPSVKALSPWQQSSEESPAVPVMNEDAAHRALQRSAAALLAIEGALRSGASAA